MTNDHFLLKNGNHLWDDGHIPACFPPYRLDKNYLKAANRSHAAAVAAVLPLDMAANRR